MSSKLLNLTMLYVEDDKDVRESTAELFSSMVREIFVAKDGVEALKIFQEENIHFVISDYQMPRMNGNELCRKIKDINPLVSFVLLTAYNDTNLLINAIDSGVDKFLKKPFMSKQLFHVLHTIEEKISHRFELEKSTVCLQEAERIALLSYWDVNMVTKEVVFSEEAIELFELDKSECVTYIDFLDKIQEEDKEKFINIFEKKIYEEESVDEIIVLQFENLKDRYIHVVAKQWESPVCGNNHIVGMFQDVSQYEEEKLKLIEESQLDPMLNISNKKDILLKIEAQIKMSKRYKYNFGIIFFDVDDFKAINEQLGHLQADNILIELTSLVQNNIRQSDILGRWGGDEFIIISAYNDITATITLAKKVNQIVAQYEWTHNVNINISMGIAFYKDGDDVKTLLHRADMKMFEAKKDGKNRFRY